MALLAFFYLGQTEEDKTTNENVSSPIKQAEENNQEPQSEPKNPPNVIIISDSDTAPETEPGSTTELDCNNPRTPKEEAQCLVIAVNSDQNTDGEPEPEPELDPAPEPDPEPELEEEYLIFNGDQFNHVFNEADLANLTSIEGIALPMITGKPEYRYKNA